MSEPLDGRRGARRIRAQVFDEDARIRHVLRRAPKHEHEDIDAENELATLGEFSVRDGARHICAVGGWRSLSHSVALDVLLVEFPRTEGPIANGAVPAAIESVLAR